MCVLWALPEIQRTATLEKLTLGTWETSSLSPDVRDWIDMNDDPMDMADRLTRYVDELIVFRRQKNAPKIEDRLLMIKNVLDKLKQAYAVASFPPGIVERVRRDKERAGLPPSFES